MTIYGWDASHYDRPPTTRDGIDFYTHKIAEGHRGFYTDDEYAASLAAARQLGIPILGAYYVNHPGDQSDQVDWAIELADRLTPWWREHPAFVWQIDAEKFEYMSRAPSLAEINAFGDRLVTRTGISPRQVLVYAPRWLYGDRLTGCRYRLWASDYGSSNPAQPYRQAYPGDTSTRWRRYSGQTPLILQYGSRTTIAGQPTCDANAYRGTLDELLAEIGADDMADTVGDVAAQYRLMSLMTLDPKWAGADEVVLGARLRTVPVIELLKRLDAAAIASAARESAALAAIQALASAGGVDAAPIVAAVNRVGAELGTKLAAATAEIDRLQAQLAAAEQRQADAARAAADAYEDGGTQA